MAAFRSSLLARAFLEYPFIYVSILCEWSGDISDFIGSERISFDDKVVFTHDFRGGVIDLGSQSESGYSWFYCRAAVTGSCSFRNSSPTLL